MRSFVVAAVVSAFVAALLVVVICAAESLAQDPSITELEQDLAMQAALATREAAQAELDSLQAVRSLSVAQAVVDSLYPDMLDRGVRLSKYTKDPLYVQVEIPFERASAEGRLLWREGFLKVREADVKFFAEEPWTFVVHRVNVGAFLSPFNEVFNPVVGEN